MALIHHAPALAEERSTNVMLGAEWQPDLWRGQALFEVNVFSTSLDDLFHVREADDPATPTKEFVKENFGRARVHGVEMNAGWGRGDAFVLQGAGRAAGPLRAPRTGLRQPRLLPHARGTATSRSPGATPASATGSPACATRVR